jgi:NitT/TauT family transport system substrate-binding protein
MHDHRRLTVKRSIVSFAVLLIAVIAIATGVSRAQEPVKLKHVRIGTGPGTCQAPIFVAHELGFFKKEGLDSELILSEFDVQKEQLATGKIEAVSGLLDKWLKPMEQGLDIKFSAGIHFGCLQILVPIDSPIKSVKDLKGKRIGVPVIGDGPTVFASRVLVKYNLNPKSDVQWVSFPQQMLELAMERKDIDAVSLSDPLTEIAVQQGKARALVNASTDAPWKNDYCCLVALNGAFAKRDPQTAAAITRAILNAAVWVREHPREAASLIIEKNYIPSKDVQLNAYLLRLYHYTPSVKGGRDAILNSAKACKLAGILDPATDPVKLAANIWTDLPGLTKFK